MNIYNDPWHVEQAAKIIRIRRLAAQVARKNKNLSLALHHEKLAREQESSLRDFATECELEQAQQT